MTRKCSHCGKDFVPQELARQESKEMEAERKAQGLEGLLFRCYSCSACGYLDIFVDVHPLAGESEEAFCLRKEELEDTVRRLSGEGVEAVLVTRA
jgi:hypothetical protein